MDNFQQKNNQEQKTRPDRFANPAPRRNLPDPVRLAKIRKKSRRKRQKYLLFLAAALIVLIIGIVLIVKGCSGGGTDPLCGKWDLDGTTVYVRMLRRRNGSSLRKMGSGRHHRLCV